MGSTSGLFERARRSLATKSQHHWPTCPKEAINFRVILGQPWLAIPFNQSISQMAAQPNHSSAAGLACNSVGRLQLAGQSASRPPSSSDGPSG